MTDLTKLDRYELGDLARERELAFHAVLAEIARRDPVEVSWSEPDAAGQLAIYRDGGKPDLHKIEDMPPALFRIGYEWACISMVRLFEGILSHPSADACMVQDMRQERGGLYRPVGKGRVSDPRRRAALDLIEMAETFHRERLKFFFTKSPPKRDDRYAPGDDAESLKDYTPRPSSSDKWDPMADGSQSTNANRNQR